MSRFQLGEVEPFEWPASDVISAYRRDWRDAFTSIFSHKADTSIFANWLWKIGERDDLSWRRLSILYEEFCAMEGLIPLAPRALQNTLQSAGITKRRGKQKVRKNGRLTKPTIYRVDPYGMARNQLSRAA